MRMFERLQNWFGSKPVKKAYHFKVCWLRKHPKAASQVADYLMPGLKELLAMLKESENVTTQNTALLVIHQINSDGTVTEVLSHDEATGRVNIDFRGVTAERSATRTRVLTEGYRSQERVLSAVGAILDKAKVESQIKPVEKPKIKAKHDKHTKKLKPFVMGGFRFPATAAEGGTDGDSSLYSKRKKAS